MDKYQISQPRDYNKCSFLTGQYKTGIILKNIIRFLSNTLFILIYLEDCSCFGYKFKSNTELETESKDYNITLYRASEIPECAVVRVSDKIPEGQYPLALKFSLEKDKEKFLTQGGKTALLSLYNSLPVHSSINIDKFFSHSALGYCNTFSNKSTQILPCVDRPFFFFNVNTRKNKDSLTAAEFFLIKYGIPIGFCVFLLAVPYLANAYKHSHVQ